MAVNVSKTSTFDRNAAAKTGRRGLYQGALIMTHRERAGDPPGQWAGRREAAGDAGHRQGFPTPAGGSPARPERRLPKAFGRPIAIKRGTWLPMSRIATPRAPGRKPWETVSMSQYQGPLVLHPEYAEGRRLDRRVERRRDAQAQRRAGIERIDDAVVPQPGPQALSFPCDDLIPRSVDNDP